MCHSLDASLGALVIGWIGCILLFLSGSSINRNVSLMLAYVISMQLIEALMWMDQKCNGLNQIASKIGFLQNIGQPIVIFIALLPFLSKDKTIPKSMLCIYILALIIFIIRNFTSMKNDKFWCTKAGNGGLQWNWSGKQDMFIWITFVASVAATMFYSKMSKFTSFATFATLLASYFRYGSSKAVGSWWCLYAICLPYIQLLTQ